MNHSPRINWSILSRAIEFYESLGYFYLEVPWIVPRSITSITMPSFVTPFQTQHGDLVGSAEQSFLKLASENLLPAGRYVALTPCFRDDQITVLHQKHFMKVELIHLHPRDPEKNLNQVLQDALLFFSSFMHAKKISIGGEENQMDIVSPSGVEVGSYGIRTHQNLTWVYGTGVAEPRLSTVLAHGW